MAVEIQRLGKQVGVLPLFSERTSAAAPWFQRPRPLLARLGPIRDQPPAGSSQPTRRPDSLPRAHTEKHLLLKVSSPCGGARKPYENTKSVCDGLHANHKSKPLFLTTPWGSMVQCGAAGAAHTCCCCCCCSVNRGKPIPATTTGPIGWQPDRWGGAKCLRKRSGNLPCDPPSSEGNTHF